MTIDISSSCAKINDMKNKKITYSEVGDNYETKDPIKN